MLYDKGLFRVKIHRRASSPNTTAFGSNPAVNGQKADIQLDRHLGPKNPLFFLLAFPPTHDLDFFGLTWCLPGPAFESMAEAADLGVAKEKGDFHSGEIALLQIAQRQFFAQAVEQSVE